LFPIKEKKYKLNYTTIGCLKRKAEFLALTFESKFLFFTPKSPEGDFEIVKWSGFKPL
jgi:hypothetical protein